jgi:hypothetical protein
MKSGNIWKIWKKPKLNCEKDMENTEEYGKIGKIQKTIVK